MGSLTSADRRLAERVVSEGLLPQAAVEAALAELAQRRGAGEEASLGPLLLARGLKPRQLAAVASSSDTRTMVLGPPDSAARDESAASDETATVWRRLADLGPAVRIRLPSEDGDHDSADEGERLGPFRRVREIARGGMARVLAGEDRDFGRVVAIKVATRHSSQDYVLHKFLLEAQITGQLEHPQIVPVYRLGLLGPGEPYFSMKRVRGLSLEALLRGLADNDPALALRPTRVALLRDFLKVCDAVRYAHSRGVVHRDLKPANIMVGAFGEVYVMDWGVAKVRDLDELRRLDSTALPSLDDTAPRTLQGTIVGTPHYMAPEQARGAEVDERADVYALGAILYEILTLQRAFDGRDPIDLIQRVIVGQLVPPRRRAPHAAIPAELEAVVLKAMALEPADRYASVGALQRDIEVFLEGGLLSAARYTPLQRLGKLLRRHRPLAIGVGLGVVALIGGSTMRELEYGTLRRRHLALQDRLHQLETQPMSTARLDATRRLLAAESPPADWSTAGDAAASLAQGDRWHTALAVAISMGLDDAEPTRRLAAEQRIALCLRAMRQALEQGHHDDATRWLDRAADRGLPAALLAELRAELAARRR